MLAPLPANETERLAAVLSCGVLDTAPERAFDDAVKLASQLCGTPYAVVSIIDRDRNWFKAKVGFEAAEESRNSFCAYAILGRGPLIVPDALDDPRFCNNPFVVGPPYLRFYAGVPLILDDGLAVGTLCVLDTVKRQLTPLQIEGLERLARQVTIELSLRRRLRSALPGAAPPHQTPTFVDVAVGGASSSTGENARVPVRLGALVAKRYRVDRVLGIGGMGCVVAGTDLRTERRVAIKFMLPDALASHEHRERFVREAQALLKINAEHVTRVFDVGNLPSGEPYIVMEYLEGEDLAARLRARGKLPWREAVDLVLAICAGVESAHRHGILHRDLKPANVFLARSPDGRERVKVLDFGVSKLWSERQESAPTGLTNAASMLGTPRYMSPEQMVRGADVDERTDVWSLGVILFELVAGRPPFVGDGVAELCAQIITVPAPSLADGAPDAPAALCEVVSRSLAKRPEERLRSVRQLADALRRLRTAEATAQPC